MTPAAALIDQPVRVSIRGLPARAVTTVTATAKDAVAFSHPAEGRLGEAARPAGVRRVRRRPRPTVVLRAALLAAHGYPALALAFWKAPGSPQELRRIPLEYFRRALTVLRAQPGVDRSHVLVTGVSWGGEGSLLVAATYPDLVHGVIADVHAKLLALLARR